ncbi:hypothetical protein WJS89_10525 [Sphingomicrobium sp. XHP0235]|uniref:hypothetical protein n=1 Tax=Sphingomicrobium aquimarinum TaxID=3133971 RepID=UPI0031FE745D
MRLRPDDLPDMEKGEVRSILFKLAGAVGINSIASATFEQCDGLSFGTPAINGTNVTVLMTAERTGTHMARLTADLSSDEIVKGACRVKVVDSLTDCSGDDY